LIGGYFEPCGLIKVIRLSKYPYETWAYSQWWKCITFFEFLEVQRKKDYYENLEKFRENL
jgi:hypothetical protein